MIVVITIVDGIGSHGFPESFSGTKTIYMLVINIPLASYYTENGFVMNDYWKTLEKQKTQWLSFITMFPQKLSFEK